MNTLLLLGIALLLVILAGSHLSAAAQAVYGRLKTLRVPQFDWSGNVTLNLPKTLLLAAAVALIAVGVRQGGCSMPRWPWVSIGSTSPISDAGFRVLIVEETDERAKLSAGQYEAMFSTDAGSLRAYVEGKGGTLRVLDKDSDPAMLDAPWQKLMARPRQSVPWLEAANPPRGAELALPAEESQAIAAVKQVGG